MAMLGSCCAASSATTAMRHIPANVTLRSKSYCTVNVTREIAVSGHRSECRGDVDAIEFCMEGRAIDDFAVRAELDDDARLPTSQRMSECNE
jgi:hypothetical protein